jgi:tetratricopeptide (TPR) repeat protein
MLAESQGDYEAARTFHQQSLDLAQALGDRPVVASILVNLGMLSESQGEHETARKFYQQSMTSAQALGDRKLFAHILALQGLLAAKTGRKAEARNLLDQAIQIYAALRAPVLGYLQHERAALGDPPDLVPCRNTCQDLASKGELRTSIYECVKVLCAD